VHESKTKRKQRPNPLQIKRIRREPMHPMHYQRKESSLVFFLFQTFYKDYALSAASPFNTMKQQCRLYKVCSSSPLFKCHNATTRHGTSS
jgi:hypothetical protein